MADMFNEHKKSVFGDNKARTILITLLVILVIFLIIGYFSFRHAITKTDSDQETSVAGAPLVKSVPGVGTPSREYAKLQEQQNVELASAALKEKTAAVPTLTGATYLGNDSANVSFGGEQAGCDADSLKKAKLAGVSVSELRCKGCSASALKAAGYTAGELSSAGFSAQQLKDAGFTAAQLKDAGFTAEQLKAAGFSPADLKNAGFTAGELKRAGFNDNDLLNAGFTKNDLQNIAQNCEANSLAEARAKGITAAALKNCGAAALKAAGFSAQDLKNAGFSAGELRKAGFTAGDLKAAGFTAKQLHDAGFAPQELKDAGFSAQDLKDAGYSDGDILRAGLPAVGAGVGKCDINTLRSAHDSGTSAANFINCNPAALKAAGYSASDLKNAGFSPRQLRDAGFSAQDLKNAGFSPQQLRDAGFSAQDLKNAGFSAQQLRDAGFSPQELKSAGFSPQDLKNAGLSDSDIYGLDGTDYVSPGGSASAVIPPVVDKQQAVEDELSKIREQQDAALSAQQAQDKIQALQQDMQGQVNDLFASWTAMPKQQYVASAVVDKDEAAAGNGGKASADGKDTANGPTLKAGTILFATLDTGINSDEQSPILATIVQGKFKGAKLMGKFERVDKKVTLQFSLLNLPQLDKSVPITAYAIDPNTARTVLASNVDNHYLMRYGTLFASAFMEGLGQAIQQSGSTTVDFGNGSIQTIYKTLNPTEQVLSGLGKVGQTFGQQLGNIFNTPPTVKVEPGVSIGILLMQDLQIPCASIGSHAECAI